MTDSVHDRRLLGVLAVYAIVVFSGLKSFALWDQVRLLLDASPGAMMLQAHPHALRFLVVQPAVMAYRLGINPDPAWTLCCFLLVIATALLCARAASLKGPGHLIASDKVAWPLYEKTAWPLYEEALRAPALAVLGAVSLFMNGRLIPAFAGVALALAILAERRAGVARWTWVPGLLIALLLASVSSGTLAIAVAACVLAWLAAPGTSRWLGAGIAGIGAALVAGGAWKALTFFKGDVLAALAHGPGAFLAPLGTAAGGVILVLLGLVLAWAIGREPSRRPMRLVVLAAVAAGLFGWSTLAVGLVPALVVVLAWAAPAEPA